MHLLIHNGAHVATWHVLGDHIQVLKRLERIVQLGHKFMVNLSLDLLLRDYEASQSVVGSFFHALHGVELAGPVAIRMQTLDQVHLSVGARAKNSQALEVLSLHVEVSIGEGTGTLPRPGQILAALLPGHNLAALSFLFFELALQRELLYAI